MADGGGALAAIRGSRRDAADCRHVRMRAHAGRTRAAGRGTPVPPGIPAPSPEQHRQQQQQQQQRQYTHPPRAQMPQKPPLPQGWDAHWDQAQQRYYYHNAALGVTDWEIRELSETGWAPC